MSVATCFADDIYVAMDFAEKLGILIELRGTSQPKLARQVGIPQSGISKMTSGTRRPYLDQGFAIAQALGVSVDFLADDRRAEVPTEVLSDLEREVGRIIRTIGVEEAYRRLVQAPASGRLPREVADEVPPRENPGRKESAG
jgi:transcriptional regulator with XRE-family HTH domain